MIFLVFLELRTEVIINLYVCWLEKQQGWLLWGYIFTPCVLFCDVRHSFQRLAILEDCGQRGDSFGTVRAFRCGWLLYPSISDLPTRIIRDVPWCWDLLITLGVRTYACLFGHMIAMLAVNHACGTEY